MRGVGAGGMEIGKGKAMRRKGGGGVERAAPRDRRSGSPPSL